jgi:hypothetical protein
VDDLFDGHDGTIRELFVLKHWNAQSGGPRQTRETEYLRKVNSSSVRPDVSGNMK